MSFYQEIIPVTGRLWPVVRAAVGPNYERNTPPVSNKDRFVSKIDRPRPKTVKAR